MLVRDHDGQSAPVSGEERTEVGQFVEVGRHAALVEQPYQALAQAALTVGSPQIRNEATIGGNLCSAVSCADGPPPLCQSE